MGEVARTAFVVERDLPVSRQEDDWIHGHISRLKKGNDLAENQDNINRDAAKKQDHLDVQPGERKLKDAESEMKSSWVSQIGAPRLSLLFLVLALLGAGAFAFLFVRELSLHQSAVSQLTQAEQERAELSQAVSQLRTEVTEQREEISRLVADLKAANAKAGLVDTIRSEHEAELARMQAHYEEQVGSLRDILQIRDEVIATFESNLNSIRELLKGPASELDEGFAGARRAIQSRTIAAGGLKPSVPPGMSVPQGRVLKVNPEHHFIVVSLGPNEGAQEGRYVQLYRSGTFLGEGRIDRVYQNLSAATVLSEDTLSHIREGDQVFLVL